MIRARFFTIGMLAVVVMLTAAWTNSTIPALSVPVCSVLELDPNPPAYYQIDLVTTRKVSGTRIASGTADVTYVPSPFGVSISPSGTYVYDLDIKIERMNPATTGSYAVWITTPDLKNVKLLGTLDENHQIRGRVDWNKYLVVVSLETEIGDRWSGPIVLRGMSRSGLMHTMAGHGPFETENCAVYGYS